jgi:D-alanine-D-alanine ligase
MKRLRVTVLFNTEKPPPTDQDYSKEIASGQSRAAFDVHRALASIGHESTLVGTFDDLHQLVRDVEASKPDVVFQLVETFRRKARYEVHVASLLELIGVPFTGSPPEALLLSCDKSLAKKVLAWHGIRGPEFATYDGDVSGPVPSALRFPLIVKPLGQDASIGISLASVVRDEGALRERVQFLRSRFAESAIVEELVPGREIYACLLEGDELDVLPLVEMKFSDALDEEARIATWKAKWDEDYRRRHSIRSEIVQDLDTETVARIAEASRTAFRSLLMRGYARLDLRLAPDGTIYLLEANPNPYLADEEDFARSAKEAGIEYVSLCQRILDRAIDRPRA